MRAIGETMKNRVVRTSSWLLVALCAGLLTSAQEAPAHGRDDFRVSGGEDFRHIHRDGRVHLHKPQIDVPRRRGQYLNTSHQNPEMQAYRHLHRDGSVHIHSARNIAGEGFRYGRAHIDNPQIDRPRRLHQFRNTQRTRIDAPRLNRSGFDRSAGSQLRSIPRIQRGRGSYGGLSSSIPRGRQSLQNSGASQSRFR